LVLTAELLDRWLLYVDGAIAGDAGPVAAARAEVGSRRQAGISEDEVAFVEAAVAEVAAQRRVEALTQAHAVAAVEQTRHAMRALDAGAKAIVLLNGALGVDGGRALLPPAFFGKEALVLAAWARITQR
jgi:hypothetical protein